VCRLDARWVVQDCACACEHPWPVVLSRKLSTRIPYPPPKKNVRKSSSLLGLGCLLTDVQPTFYRPSVAGLLSLASTVSKSAFHFITLISDVFE